MRKVVLIVLVLVAVTGVAMLTGCEDGTQHYPTIAFRIRSDSTTQSDNFRSLPRDTTFMLVVYASKTGPDGLLKTFKITRSVNGGADTTLIDAELNTQYFSQFYSYNTGDSGNIERYTFTVGTYEGLTETIFFEDTVK
jgi:hypothetical protein